MNKGLEKKMVKNNRLERKKKPEATVGERERMLQALMNSKSDFVKTSLPWSIRAAIYI